MAAHTRDSLKSIRRRRLAITLGLAALATLASLWWWMHSRPPGPFTSLLTLAGDGPQITSGNLSDPFGIAADKDGNIYVADGRGGRIHRIDKRGSNTIIASGLDMPSGLAIADDGSILAAETGSHIISRIDARTGAKTILAGAPGQYGYADGPSARFNGPIGVAVDGDGNIFVADTYNDRIRIIARDGAVRTLAGGAQPGYRDGAGREALFDTPCGVALLPDKTLIVADTANHRLRRVTMDGDVTTIAGTGAAESRDGALADASFDEPIAAAVRRDGAVAVTDAASSTLRLIVFGETPSVSTIAGGYPFGLYDGAPDEARLNRPAGAAFAPDDSLVFADNENGVVRAVLPEGAKRPGRTATQKYLIPAASLRAAVAPRWPFNPPEARREIAGTFGEVRGEVLPEHDAWFHSGLDVPGAYGETVRAVFNERITRPMAVEGVGASRERVRFPLFGYIHLRIGRDAQDRPLPGIEARGVSFRRDETGAITGVRIRRGARFDAGDPLGTLNRLNHVHLVAGPASAEVNAIAALDLPGLVDTVAPVIENISITNQYGIEFPRTGAKGNQSVEVRGRARIIVYSYDQMDGNAGYRRLGLYRLGYQVLTADGRPAPGFEAKKETIVFERLPEHNEGVARVYAEGSQSGYEGRTIFAYIVTNRAIDGEAHEDFLDADKLAPGEYLVRVFVADYHGNETRRDVRITRTRNDGN
ncbi:MAG: hypothetical protein KF868_04085 [Acidobacteria bacterium]|nr:hypothetical protein [Acidobacteriota bacterium]